VEAGLEALVVQHKGAAFPGEATYAERRRTGPLRKLVGFTVAGSDAPPVGATVHAAGRAVDRVRSIGTSPRFGVIGMSAVPLGADAPGTPLVISSSGQEWQAVVAKTPFVEETP
jgi:glycine cleavage system aminomethyltransferase T